MKNNTENIPGFIFDWMEKHNFSSLAPVQQTQVLACFSAEEYDELHQSVAGIRGVQRQTTPTGRQTRKEQLLQRFDEAHKPKKAGLRLLAAPIPLWQAAAVFMVLGGAWLYYSLTQKGTAPSQQLYADKDTVYLTREIASNPVEIFDTVYIERENARQNKVGEYKPGGNAAPQNITGGAGPNLHVLSLREMDSLPNNQKHNSIKDDTLIKKYAFVTLL